MSNSVAVNQDEVKMGYHTYQDRPSSVGLKFIQVRPVVGWGNKQVEVNMIRWPFQLYTCDTFADMASAIRHAVEVANGLPIATPAHIAVSNMVAADVQCPQGYDYKFWQSTVDRLVAAGAPLDMAQSIADVDAHGIRYATAWAGDDEGEVGI